MNESKIFNYKTVIIMLAIMLFLSTLNMCNSCTSNSRSKKNEQAIEKLTQKTDSNLTLINRALDSVPNILQKNDDWQTAKFLYWERKADGAEFSTYTPKDYFDLIKKDK